MRGVPDCTATSHVSLIVSGSRKLRDRPGYRILRASEAHGLGGYEKGESLLTVIHP